MFFLKLCIGFFEILNLYSNIKIFYFEIIINSQETANIVKDVGLILGFFPLFKQEISVYWISFFFF